MRALRAQAGNGEENSYEFQSRRDAVDFTIEVMRGSRGSRGMPEESRNDETCSD